MKKIEVLNNILKKIGEVDTKIHPIFNANGSSISNFAIYLESKNGETGIKELDYFKVNSCELYMHQYKDTLVKVSFVVNYMKKITDVFDRKIVPISIEFDKNGNVVVRAYRCRWDTNIDNIRPNDVVAWTYEYRWNINVDKVNKKLKITQESKFFPSNYDSNYELEIDLEKFELSNLLEEYPS